MIEMAIAIVSAGVLAALGIYGVLELVCADEQRRQH